MGEQVETSKRAQTADEGGRSYVQGLRAEMGSRRSRKKRPRRRPARHCMARRKKKSPLRKSIQGQGGIRKAVTSNMPEISLREPVANSLELM